MDRQTRLFYEFGPFQLDASERVLRRADQTLPLTPKGVEILLALVEQRGRLVGKDELMDRVWADAFVEPANLTQTVSMLRKVLEDDSQTPRYIQTVPKRGYRFIAEVREVTLEEEHVTVEEHVRSTVTIKHEEEDEAAPPWRRLMPGWHPRTGVTLPKLVAFGLGGLGLSVGLILYGAWRAQPPRPANLRFVQLVAERGREISALAAACFSPDGRLIAFAADGDGQNLRIMQVNGSQPVQVTRDKWRDTSPVWSPDGNRLAFVSNRGNQVGIWTVPFLGGEIELVKILGDSALDGKVGPPLLKAWARDGRSIYYEWNRNLYRLDLRSKESQQLTRFDPRTQFPGNFALSSDERWIAYTDNEGGQFDLWRLGLSGGSPLRVTNDPAIDRHPLWHPDGRRLLYDSVRDGRQQVYQVDVTGGEPAPLAGGDHDGFLVALSPSGEQILCYSQRDEADLFAVGLEDGVERQLTGELGVEYWPSVAPDGTAIAFQAIAGERFNWDPRRGTLFIKSLGAEEKPQRLAAEAFSAQWSPNGEQVAFLRWKGQAHSLWTVAAMGGAEKQLVSDGVFYGGQAGGPTYNRVNAADYGWSPDSRRLAYCAKQDGVRNVWVISADGTGATNVSTNRDPQQRFHSPLWSPEGAQLAYVSTTDADPQAGQQAWQLWVGKPGQARLIFHTKEVLRLLGWTTEQELIVALVANEDLNRVLPATVRVIVLATTGSALEAEQRATHLLAHTYLNNLHLSPDRRNVSFVAAQDGREDIWILSLNGGQTRRVTNNADGKLHYSGLAWAPDGKALYFSKQSKWNLLSLIANLH